MKLLALVVAAALLAAAVMPLARADPRYQYQLATQSAAGLNCSKLARRCCVADVAPGLLSSAHPASE